MRYSHSTGLYALAMSTVLGACDNGPTVPASALEQTVAHAQESSKIDLSTPEKAVRSLLNSMYITQNISSVKQHFLAMDTSIEKQLASYLKFIENPKNSRVVEAYKSAQHEVILKKQGDEFLAHVVTRIPDGQKYEDKNFCVVKKIDGVWKIVALDL